MATIIDGKQVSFKIKEELKKEVIILKEKGINPALAVVIVGDDPASRVYVNSKKKSCGELGIESIEYSFDSNLEENKLLELINKLNSDDNIHGILVQLPLPKHIDEEKVLNNILPSKDVDGFHPTNVGKLSIGKPCFASCTPAGVIELLKHYEIDISGKNCVIVGRSNIVGKPMGMLLLQNNGTVTICHSKTKDLKNHTKNADILVAAIGKPNFITVDMVKEGVVVLDVGINRTENKKLVGDVDFENVKNVASYITPVPGGAGPMTIAMLMKNTVEAAKMKV